jgi:putative transposase
MIDRTHKLPIVRQCQILEMTRSSASYQPTPVVSADLALMRRIDGLQLAYPFA